VSVLRPRWLRSALLPFVLGVLAASSMREASAAQQFDFHRTFTLSEAGLQGIDGFGAFWFFDRGQFRLDASGTISDDGSCTVSVTGFGDGSGLNYKTGTGASLSVFFMAFRECNVDPRTGTIEVGVPFHIALGGQGGGTIPAHMTVSISSSGVSIAGITIGSDDDDP
jgi:hypothetical protein